MKLLTTQCMILEIEKLAQVETKLNGALHIIKQYPVHKCGHEKNSISGAKCFNFMISNNNSSR